MLTFDANNTMLPTAVTPDKGYNTDGLWGQVVGTDKKLTSASYIPMCQGNITPMNTYFCQNIDIVQGKGFSTYLFDDLNTFLWKGVGHDIVYEYRPEIRMLKPSYTSIPFEHFHAYHACSYRKSYCCCSIMRNQNIIPARRRTVPKSKLTKEDILRVLKYHSSTGRKICYVGLEGTDWRHVIDSADCTDGQSLPEGFLEVCDYQGSNLPAGGRRGKPDVGRFEGRDSGDSNESTGRHKDKWLDTVNSFLNNYITVPVRNALCLSEWRTLPGHLHINKQCFKVINVIEDVEFKYLGYTVRDFYDMYGKSDKIIYFKCLTMEEYNRKYLSLRDSVISVLELLYFQFNYMDAVDKFLRLICNVCDFKQSNIKKNSLWVRSPNSAGKNYFFDALCDSFILVGQIKNPIRNYTFGFMNCVNKRILQWNEAVVDPYFYEDVKPILAGDSPNVQVKNRDDGVVRATPVFILSNRLTFPDTSEFNCRLHKYEWNTCPLLKLYKKGLIHEL